MRQSIYISITLVFFLLLNGCTDSTSVEEVNTSAIQQLEELGIEINSDSFIQQIEKNNNPVVVLFIKAGIDPNIPNKHGEISIVKASINGNDDLVQLLINSGASVNLPNSNGTTALMAASANKNLKTVLLLLKNEADVHAEDNEGYNALMLAIRNGDLEVMKALLDAGSDANLPEGENKEDLLIFTEEIFPETGQLLEEYKKESR
ncbi:MAG TPA: ankyrin repeat domain-containing protein [Brevibacillus sp.]|nr:ankyrin repeat domain-containing protein [Brevibacillus sp.]